MKVKFETIEIARVTATCPMCGAETEIIVDKPRFDAWQAGELIQRVFPDYTRTQREILITGLCPDCQEKLREDEERMEEMYDALDKVKKVIGSCKTKEQLTAAEIMVNNFHTTFGKDEEIDAQFQEYLNNTRKTLD